MVSLIRVYVHGIPLLEHPPQLADLQGEEEEHSPDRCADHKALEKQDLQKSRYLAQGDNVTLFRKDVQYSFDLISYTCPNY